MKLELSGFGFSQPFSILDPEDQKKMFRDMVKKAKLDPKEFDPKYLAGKFQRGKPPARA